MNLEFLGFCMGSLGKVLVAFTAISVHHRFWKEHRVDDMVFRAMRIEQIVGIIGILLIIIGSILEGVYRF